MTQLVNSVSPDHQSLLQQVQAQREYCSQFNHGEPNQYWDHVMEVLRTYGARP
jgi:hypothetical protein